MKDKTKLRLVEEQIGEHEERYYGFVYTSHLRRRDINTNEREYKGLHFYKDNSLYLVSMAHGQMAGIGLAYFPQIGLYEGDFNDGKRFGTGKLVAHSKQCFIGYWKNDIQEGFGVEISEKGERYQGFFVQGKKHGKGKYTWANGDFYAGTFKNDVVEGQGYMNCANGRTYTGQWKDGQPNGQGTIEYATGEEYEGELKGWVKHGKGKFIM